MKKNKILLISEFQNKKIFSYELKDSLKEFYDVDTFDTLPFSKYKNKFKKILDKFLLYLLRYLDIKIYYNVFRRKILYQKILQKCNSNNYKFIIFTKNHYIDPKIFLFIESKTYYYFFDTIDEIKRYSLFNHFRFADRSYVISKMLSKKINKSFNLKTYFCPQFINTNFWYNKNSYKDIDVLFIGTKFKYRNEIITYLENNDISVVKKGLGWNKQPIFGNELIKTMARSKIILNFTRDKLSFSVRVYQVLCTGNFLLSSKSYELNNTFNKKQHFDDFDSKEDCLSKVSFYLNNPQKIKKIAKNGMNYVNRNFNSSKIIKKYFI